jgi:excisionase family DNA binding protein
MKVKRAAQKPKSSAIDRPVERLTVRPLEAAAMLGISRRTVWSWVTSGRLEVVRLPGSSLCLITVASIRRLLELPPAAE